MDNLTKQQRHKSMSNIRSKDTKIEMILRKALWSEGIRYRKNYTVLVGTERCSSFLLSARLSLAFGTDKGGTLIELENPRRAKKAERSEAGTLAQAQRSF